MPRRALWLAALIMLLVTPNYPWYYIWLLPLLAVTPVPALLYLTYAIALNYPAWWAFSAAGPMAAVQYLPVYVLGVRRWALGVGRWALGPGP